ncbi:ABC transporter ATP-binding protein [Pleurocapsales cyanobacterium LEGE 06147]|nr:ABC transporter ATP-binding protein [Pleurocapsales cyanobacterium LEGE 06147]
MLDNLYIFLTCHQWAISYVLHRFYRIIQGWLIVYHKARLAGTWLWGTSVGLFIVGNALALAVSTYLWNQQAITIGGVYLLFHYSNLLRDPIEKIREELEDLQKAEASIYRIQELLQIQPQLSAGGDRSLPKGALAVTFEEVCFSYESQRVEGKEEREPVLQGISFHLPPGQMLGILGRTGSGKTTLARLLLRLYEPQSGTIRLGNIGIDSTPLIELPQYVGIVTQDVKLFQTTVRNNLTLFNPKIGEEQILQVLEEMGLLTWLQSLPQGLETQLGADNGSLSAGQAQLLAFARIFLKDPGLVILDEASSRLDPFTETLIEQAVDKLLQGRTGVIIAHRLKTIQRADQILILEKGKVIEYGPREQLKNDANSRFSQLLQTSLMEVLA